MYNKNMKLIEVSKFKIAIADNLVLDEVDWSMESGELALFTGANGSGKTTFVRALLGLTPLQSGKIKFDGQPWSIEFVSQKIGYLPQYAKIDRHFPISVRELIQLSCSKDVCSDPKHHLAYLDSEQLIDRPISDLSGGEFQRVMIARALENSPKLIIYDEPTNNLDEKTSKKVFELIADFQKQGIAQIIITHNHELVHAFKKKKVYVFMDKKVALAGKHHV